VLFGLSSPSPVPERLDAEIEWVDGSLNESQKDAIRFALASKEVALIHGPPGVSNFGSYGRVVVLTDLHEDWEDSYNNRAHFADAQARIKDIGMWAV
jgi:hypothetical protein